MKVHLRLMFGAAAVAGLCMLTARAADIPADSAKAATAADVAEIQKKMEVIAEAPDKNKGSIRTVKSLVLSIGVYGDAATQGQAAKVLLALDKKDYKGALEAAKGLSSPKADPAAVKSIQGKFELDDVMSAFRASKSGGANVEKDMKDALKAGTIDAKAAEVIGSRSSALAVYTEKMPNDKAKTNPSMTMKWERLSKEMNKVGKELAEEGAKGAKADQKQLQSILKRLNATCSNCHSDFRDE